MSGGHLNYFCHSLEEHIGDFGDRELDDLVKDLAELFHDREWYLSGDTAGSAMTASSPRAGKDGRSSLCRNMNNMKGNKQHALRCFRYG